ncbi:metallophosphoesterase [Cellulomonas sp. URHB0016]
MTVIAQISDLHLDGTTRTSERASRTLAYLRNLPTPVDALLVTGDIADHGTDAEYREAAGLLDAPFPVLACPGNHDERAAYRRSLLGERPAGTPVNTVALVEGTRGAPRTAVFLCDVTIPGKDPGRFEPETLAWLDDGLRALDPGTPALVAFHHPPVAVHHPLPDSCRLEDPDALADLLAAHPAVVALITGHAHTAAATEFAGRPVRVGPAVTWTLRLPWEGDDVVDAEQPPGVAFHVLDDQHRLTTHYRTV